MRFGPSVGALLIFPVAILSLQSAPAPKHGIGDGGRATKATLLEPAGLAIDETNLYIVESFGRRVRRVNLQTRVITTIAGGSSQCHEKDYPLVRPGCLGSPQRVAVDSLGTVYVTDNDLGVIKIGAKPGSFSTVVPENPNLSLDSEHKRPTELDWPTGIAVDPSGGLFFADYTRHTIYRFGFENRTAEIIAGTGREGSKGDEGPGKDAEFRFPGGLARDGKGNLFIADSGNCRIQRVDARTGIVTTVTGTGENGSTCELVPDTGATRDEPSDVAVGESGDVFFVQPSRGQVKRFRTSTGQISIIAGNGEWGFSGDGGPAIGASLHEPSGIALDQHGNLYISDTNNGRVRRVDLKTGTNTTIAGNGPVMQDIML